MQRRVFGDKHWNEPLKWDREAEKEGRKHLVFCASMADVMDDEAPEGQRERLWKLIDETPNLIWQLLTKRPQRYHRYLPDGFRFGNVILMTTTENQEQYDIRWPHLATIGTELVGVSYEPALGPLTIRNHRDRPDWLIYGGESGAKRRSDDVKWAENIRRECLELGIKFFMKQMSARTPAQGKALIPAHLLIQQFPVNE
jgi:protein gp37